MSEKPILITGASGFIGYHLAKKLSEDGYNVRCLVRKESDIRLLKKLKVEIFQGDLLKVETLRKIVSGIDVVYHLAGVVDAKKKNDFYRGNVLATSNLLEALMKEKIKIFIYVSSVAVYKPPKRKLLLTERSACKPITPYGISKLKAEEIVKSYIAKYSFPAVIIRAPIIYGAYQPTILTNFFKKIIKYRKVIIFGDGEYLRSFCFVDNFINGLILFINNPYGIGRVYNISDEKVYTYNEIIERATKLIGLSVKVIRLPEFIGKIVWNVGSLFANLFGLYSISLYGLRTMTINLGCDISSIKNDYGYSPAVDLEEGLRQTFEWINMSSDETSNQIKRKGI
jgi:nucleoside-diphosphate-sugar epimerase